MRHVIAMVATLICSSTAVAGVGVEAMYGMRSATPDAGSFPGTTSKPPTLPGTEMAVDVQVVEWRAPVSIGAMVSSATYDEKKLFDWADSQLGVTGTATANLKSLDYGPEVMAWVPIPFVKPYAKVGYLMGKSTNTAKWSYSMAGVANTDNFTETFTESGTEYSVGLRLSPLPFLGLVVEYNVFNAAQKFVSITETSNGTQTTTKAGDQGAPTTDKFATSAIRVGLAIRL